MKNLNINFEKLENLKGFALALVIATPLVLTGCGKQADCNVSGNHAHMYKSNLGYVRYIEDEHLNYEGYERYDNYISIDGYEDLYKFLKKKDLMRIDDNLDLILDTQENNVDYTEYRYKYTFMQPIPHIVKSGKVTITYFTYIPHIRYSWTSNANHSRLTGETRVCHHTYKAYKVGKNDKGKYVLIESPLVDDLTIVMNEYPYIKKNYTVVVTCDGKEADYEDGKQEDMSEEDKQRTEEYEDNQNIEPQAYHFEEKGKTLVKSNT